MKTPPGDESHPHGAPRGVDRSDRRQPGTQIVGERIWELRKARDFTLKKLARESGLSVGYLSQVERNRATPSIKSLHDIGVALGVNISWFFPNEDDEAGPDRDYIVRSDRRRRLRFGSGITDELLSPNLRGDLELLYSRFEPRASSGDTPYTHRGEEGGIVLEGTLELWIGGDKFILKAGDSFGFTSKTPHRYANPTDQQTIVIWAITPPSY